MNAKVAFLAPLDLNLYLFRISWIHALKKKGFEVTAIVPDGEYVALIEKEGVRVISYPISRQSVNPFTEARTLLRLWRIFRREGFSIVHTFTIKPNIYGTFAARLAGVPVVINHVTGLGFVHTERGVFVRLLRLFIDQLYRLAFAFSRLVVFQNPDDYRMLSGLVDPAKTLVIQGTGVDADVFSGEQVDAAAVERLRAELALGPQTKVVTFIGRFLRQKGVYEFCSAAERIIAARPDVCFLLVGWLDRGNPSAVSEAFISRLRRHPSFRVLEKRSDVREILALTDVFTLPSYREGTPRTVLEAMAMQKPVVVSDSAGCRQLVSHGANGLLVPVKDAASLAAALERLLDDQPLRQALGNQARRRVVDEFSSEEIINQILRLYARIKEGLPVRRLRMCVITTVPISAATFYGRQFEFLKEHGFDVTLVTSPGREFLSRLPAGLRVCQVAMTRRITPFDDLIAFIRVLRIIAAGRFDLVQYSSPKAALLGSFSSWICRVPVRLYLMWGLYYVGQSGWKRQLLKVFEKVVCYLSTAVAPDSHGNRTFALAEKLCPSGKISVVGEGSANGVDLNRFDPQRLRSVRLDTRRALGIAEQGIVFGFVGRIRREKGINELLLAFADVSRQDARAYLLVVGPQEAGERELDDGAADILKRHPRVMKKGFCPEPEEMMCVMDVFALPSYREGFGIVNVEASALGLPVISTDIPGPRDSVLHETTGLLVPVRDSAALASAMQRLLLDERLRATMGAAGRVWAQRFEQRRHWESVLRHRLSLLHQAGVY